VEYGLEMNFDPISEKGMGFFYSLIDDDYWEDLLMGEGSSVYEIIIC
jgi:hypothetical protein